MGSENNQSSPATTTKNDGTATVPPASAATVNKLKEADTFGPWMHASTRMHRDTTKGTESAVNGLRKDNQEAKSGSRFQILTSVENSAKGKNPLISEGAVVVETAVAPAKFSHNPTSTHQQPFNGPTALRQAQRHKSVSPKNANSDPHNV